MADTTTTVSASLGLLSTAVVAIGSCVLLVLGFLGRLRLPFRKTVMWVLMGICLAALLRLTWWGLTLTLAGQASGAKNGSMEDAAYVMNRLAWMVSTIAFVFLLFGMIETVHVKYPPPSESFVTGMKIAILIVIGLITLFTFVVIVVAFSLCTQSGGVYNNTCLPIYDSHIISIAIIQALLSLLFLIYGVILLLRIRKAGGVDAAKSKKRSQVMVKIIVVTLTFFICFGIRSVMFLYRPITKQFLPSGVFYTFAYLVPDFVPPVVQCFVIISTTVSATKAAKRRDTESGRLQEGESERYVRVDDAQDVETRKSMGVPLLDAENDEGAEL